MAHGTARSDARATACVLTTSAGGRTCVRVRGLLCLCSQVSARNCTKTYICDEIVRDEAHVSRDEKPGRANGQNSPKAVGCQGWDVNLDC
jgi:hypothetical protein